MKASVRMSGREVKMLTKKRDPKIYVERLGKARTGHEVWRVNGAYIRAHIDMDFTNFAQPLKPTRIKYIPKDEFWMDREAQPDEHRFFLAHMEKEWELQNKGVPREKAYDEAIKLERKLRKGSREGKEKGPYLRQMGKSGDTTIWEVDGKFVRDWYTPDFTEGGHGLVYSWIPDDELWIDNDLPHEERQFVIAHEAYELKLMKAGVGYEEAHKKSNDKELKLRLKAEDKND